MSVVEDGFKIVAVRVIDEGKRYYSLLSHGRIEYKVDKPTVPLNGNGPLTVFDYLSDAYRFLTENASDDAVLRETTIFKCKYVPSTKRFLYLGKGRGDHWVTGDLSKSKYVEVRTTVPDGTVFAKLVVLTKEVSFEELADVVA